MLARVKKMVNFRGLMFTLAISFLALSAIVLILSNSLNLYFTYTIQQDAIASQQQLIAEDAANTVRIFIHDQISILNADVSISDILSEPEENQKLFLDKMLGHEPSFRQLVLLDSMEREIVRVSRLSGVISGQLVVINKSEMVSYIDQGETYISSVYIDKITSEPMILIAVPILDVFGDSKGTLVAEVNLKFMWDLVDSIKVGDKGVAYVVDKKGRLIAFGDISRVLRGETLIQLEEVNEFVKGDESTHVSSADITTGIMGNQVVANHAHLGSPDWAVVVEIPADEAYETVNMVVGLSLLIVLMSLGLAVFAGIYFSRRITKPIISLRDAAIKIGKGDLDKKIGIKSGDEIGELASSFNLMVSDLKASRNELKKYSESLEEKVAERTEDLRKKVEELTKTETAMANMMEDLDETNKNLIEAQSKLTKSYGELKELDVEKDQFISIAAHELKTPMTAISGFSQLLKNEKIIKDEKNRNKYLDIIIAETKRLARLVTDVLDLSRSDLGTIKFTADDINLYKFLDEIKEMEQYKTKEKGLKLEVELEPKLSKIKSDNEKLKRVLINLVDNSIKYTDKGSIKIKAVKDRNNIKFSVADTGIGIAKKYYEKIFERFYQIESAYTRKYSGTGLGLCLCKELLAGMGGRIWLESKVGKGTTFYFTIPIDKAREKKSKK